MFELIDITRNIIIFLDPDMLEVLSRTSRHMRGQLLELVRVCRVRHVGILDIVSGHYLRIVGECRPAPTELLLHTGRLTIEIETTYYSMYVENGKVTYVIVCWGCRLNNTFVHKYLEPEPVRNVMECVRESGARYFNTSKSPSGAFREYCLGRDKHTMRHIMFSSNLTYFLRELRV